MTAANVLLNPAARDCSTSSSRQSRRSGESGTVAVEASLTRLVVLARLACAVGILALTLTAAQSHGIQAALLLCLTATLAILLQTRTAVPSSWIAAGEAIATGLLISTNLPAGAVCLPYLMIPLVAAGCLAGVRSVVWVGVASSLTVCAPVLLTDDFHGAMALVRLLSPWLLTSVGVGLVGARLRAIGPVRRGDDLSYEAARRLIAQLRGVAGRLPLGLDAASMAERVLDEVQAEISPYGSVLLLRNKTEAFVSLARRGSNDRALEAPAAISLALECLRSESPLQRVPALVADVATAPPRHLIALPLHVDERMLGVVVAIVGDALPAAGLVELAARLNRYSLRLDTALAFDDVRNVATSEERRRVAGEIHDGIAQDAAAMGYLVDDLTSTAETDGQRTKLTQLRAELSRLVAELRLSIFDLRSDITDTTGLSAAIAEQLRRVDADSGLKVHISLDAERRPLRTEVETVLLRIAQEAIANARKHSGAGNLWVSCHVEPPEAWLEVADDGSWSSGQPREDSFGLRLMRERAQSVGAQIAIEPRAGGGTRVAVALRPLEQLDGPVAGNGSHGYERPAGR